MEFGEKHRHVILESSSQLCENVEEKAPNLIVEQLQ